MATSTKRALVIGIDKYPGWGGAADLDGCVNDAMAMAEVLRTTFRFPAANVRLIRDSEATRDGILEALGRLADEVDSEDVVALFYAGHGSEMRDREGDEPSGFDSTIVPYDSGRNEKWTNRDITDDEIYLWLLKTTAKTSNVTCIFDSCHSGTVLRDTFGGKTRHVPADTRSVEELPESPPELAQLEWMQQVSGGSGWLPVGNRYTLLSACRDSQLANEIKEVKRGAFSHFLTRAMADMHGPTTYRDLFESYAPLLRARFPSQHPQIEGALDREVFGIRDIATMSFVQVLGCEGSMATLDIGSAHGAEPGWTFDIYPPGTHSPEETDSIGRVSLSEVDAVNSRGTVVDSNPQAPVAIGSRAVVVDRGETSRPLTVWIDPEVRDVFTISDSDQLLRSGEATDADFCVRFVKARTDARGTLPQLGAVDADCVGIVGPDGLLRSPTRTLDDPDLPSVLKNNLVALARYRRALALENPSHHDPLRGRVSLDLLRLTGSGEWVVATAEPDSGEVVFREGERVAIRMTNNSKLDVYCSVLDFGLTGKIGPLYPGVQGAQEALAPGRSVDFGYRPGDPRLDLSFPDPLSSLDDREGIEVFKLFATTRETSFRSILQPGTRSGRAPAVTPLDDLLAGAVGVRALRDVVATPSPEAVKDPGYWTTQSRPFRLIGRTRI